jgi:zinc protease
MTRTRAGRLGAATTRRLTARAGALALAVLALTAVACRGGRGLLGRTALDVPPPAGKPAAAFTIPPVLERRLPNGLTVLAVEYPELPIFALQLVLPGGAALDPPDKAGVAELTADLLRQGTERRSAEELAREIEFLGGAVNTGAGYDFSTVSAEFLQKDLARALDLVSDVVLHPAFRQEDFRRMRGLALAGIVAARESPGAVADRCFQAFLYGRHPYGHPSQGTEASVGGLAAADVREFYRRHYGPAGAVLVVIGNAPADLLATAAAQAFAPWRPAAESAPALTPPPRVRGRRLLLVDKPDATQAHIRVGNVALARTDPAYVQALVTSTILGGGFGSRLIDELRVKRSLTYGASSVFVARKVPGELRVGTFTKVPTTGEALGVTLDVLRDFAARGATAEELARAQSLLAGQFPLQLETPNALASRLAELQAYGLPRTDLATYPARVLAVSGDDVRGLAGRYVPTDDAAIVIVGPAAAIMPQLARFGPFAKATPESCTAPGAPSALD